MWGPFPEFYARRNVTQALTNALVLSSKPIRILVYTTYMCFMKLVQLWGKFVHDDLQENNDLKDVHPDPNYNTKESPIRESVTTNHQQTN